MQSWMLFHNSCTLGFDSWQVVWQQITLCGFQQWSENCSIHTKKWHGNCTSHSTMALESYHSQHNGMGIVPVTQHNDMRIIPFITLQYGNHNIHKTMAWESYHSHNAMGQESYYLHNTMAWELYHSQCNGIQIAMGKGTKRCL